MNKIPTSRQEYDKIISQFGKRVIRSSSYIRPFQEKWVRFYKIWRTFKDQVQNSDEPNSFLPYAYGIIEKITSRTVEAILKMKPPCRVLPMHIGDAKKAENFSNISRNHFSQSEYQDQYYSSMKEMRITGTRWEIDDWANKWVKGKMWKKVPQKGILNQIKNLTGKVIPGVQQEYEYQSETEIEIDVPIEVGFRTRFPSVFNVYPEPDKKRIEDMSWIIVDDGEVAIDDLKKEFYVDENGERKPVYDFDLLEKDFGPHDPGAIVPAKKWNSETDYGRMSRDIITPTEGTADKASSNDQDRVSLFTMYESDKITTIANGKYIIRLVENPYHIPRIPMRIDRHVVDPQFIFGISVLQPIEDSIYELNDIHNLSMSNWIRIINKMVAIHIDAVPFPDDFKPRAGGKIRVRADMDVRQAIMSIDQPDVSPSMITMESNAKGIIEWASNVSDLSPGPMGTRQGHKTLGGLIEIENQLSIAFSTWQRQSLGNFQKQMKSMELFFSQYAFEKRPFRVYRDSGATVLAEFNKDDIYTEGRGFEYVIDIDPTFGDDAIQRQQLANLMTLGMQYEAARIQSRDPSMEKFHANKLFRHLLRNYGYTDPSDLFSLPNGANNPEDELTIIMNGGVIQSSDSEDRLNHIISHINQLKDQGVRQAIESGKADPETLRKLRLHIEETMAGIKGILADPELIAEKKKNKDLSGIHQ